MSSRNIRYHHFIWHNIRNLWNSLNSTTQSQIRNLGWQPPRPAKDRNGNPITDNRSGEDFLYFHRQMIATVNKLLKRYNYPSVSGFSSIPAADDSVYRMQPVYQTPSAQLTKLVSYYKSNTYYKILKAEEAKLTDPKFLRTMTLGQLGSYMEFASDVHQGLHFRFSEWNKLMRVKTNEPIPYIDPKWDVTASDWLCDVYGSQINPWFWKLHIWIDNRINDWQKAHGLNQISWTGTWTGGSMNSLPKTDNIPSDPDVRFLEKENDKNSANKDETEEASDDDCMNEMGAGMDLANLEAVANIIMGTGLHSDTFNELSNKVAPEHWDEDADKEDGSCNKNDKL